MSPAPRPVRRARTALAATAIVGAGLVAVAAPARAEDPPVTDPTTIVTVPVTLPTTTDAPTTAAPTTAPPDPTTAPPTAPPATDPVSSPAPVTPRTPRTTKPKAKTTTTSSSTTTTSTEPAPADTEAPTTEPVVDTTTTSTERTAGTVAAAAIATTEPPTSAPDHPPLQPASGGVPISIFFPIAVVAALLAAGLAMLLNRRSDAATAPAVPNVMPTPRSTTIAAGGHAETSLALFAGAAAPPPVPATPIADARAALTNLFPPRAAGDASPPVTRDPAITLDWGSVDPA